jgi:hypothetical protein
LVTVSVLVFSVLVMVQVPIDNAAEQGLLDEYPLGTGDSVPLQFGLPV